MCYKEAPKLLELQILVDMFCNYWLSRRSKNEVKAKIAELTERYMESAEGLTLEQSQNIRDISNGMTQALEWVIMEQRYL